MRRSISLDPTAAAPRKALATSYYLIGDYARSTLECREAIKLSPNDSLLFTLLGSCYFQQGEYEQARDAHNEALRIDPNNLYARFNLALALQAMESPKALAAWEDYLKRSEGDPDQEANRVTAREFYNRLKEAETRP